MTTQLFGSPAHKLEHFNSQLYHRFFSLKKNGEADSQSNEKKTVFKLRNSNLRVRDLNVYIQKNHILKNVNIDIPDKKITCIIGPSGCGKSTLLKTLNRLIDDTDGVKYEGQILIDGIDIFDKQTEITSIRKKMGLLSQRPCPLPMSNL